MVFGGKLVCYYSDKNDYAGFDPVTGVPKLAADNDTAPDSHGQILVHKTWNGRAATWSAPVVDVAGLTQSMGACKTEIGGGRPGMTNVVLTILHVRPEWRWGCRRCGSPGGYRLAGANR